MNIKRAKEEIKDTIAAYLLKDEFGEYKIPAIRQRPVLLIGPPGVGKTQIMEQIARECEIGLVAYTITHHTRQSAVGLPFIEHKIYGGKEYSVTEYTMSEIIASVYDRIRETGLKEGILFIDEINCVSETLAPTMLQFLQCKTFGSHKVPEGWIIVAAGNPPEYNKSVREFDVVTLDRIKKIIIEPDLNVWKEYAYAQNIHPAIMSYLNIRPQYFCTVETTVDGKRFATPRGWEDLSQLIQVYETLGKKTDRDVVGQYLQHPKIAKDFANYLELYYKYQDQYQVEEILSGTIREEVCDKLQKAPFDERMAVTGLLLAKLTDGFKELKRMNDTMTLLMAQLKQFKKELDGADVHALAPAMILESIGAELESIRIHKKESGLSDRRQDHIYRKVKELLEQYVQQMKARSLQEKEDSWNWLRQQFMEKSDAYEDKKTVCGERLEHAFDFMEAAFANGQELVIFVTGLNTGEASVEFLKEYNCERYYRYNKELLFDNQENEMKEVLGK